MASVSSDAADKILWTSLLIAGIAAYWYVPKILQHVKQLALVTTPDAEEIKPRLVDDAEAAIEPSTIETLASGPSYPLSTAAIRLAARRAVKDPTAVQGVLRDLKSRQPRRRDRAIQSLQLLLTEPTLRGCSARKQFTDAITHEALVVALVNILPEHESWKQMPSAYSSPLKPPHRPACETALMKLVLNLIEQPRTYDFNTGEYRMNTQPALDAGIITKWLGKYPFPCAVAGGDRYNFRRSDVVRLVTQHTWGDDDPLMYRLILSLAQSHEGCKQFIQVGLHVLPDDDEYPPPPRSLLSQTPGFNGFDVAQAFAEDQDGDTTDPEFTHLAEVIISRDGDQQPGEDSETDLRQRQLRHRQTVVVSNSEGTLNILEPPSGHDLERQVSFRQDELLHSGQVYAQNEESAADQIARERIDGLDGTAWTPTLPLLSLASSFEIHDASLHERQQSS